MNRKSISIIILLSFGIIGTYGFPYMKGTFYNVMKAALALSDRQLGRIWSVFGSVGMVSYIVGGYFTDRFSPRKILVAALGMSAALHLYVSFIPSYTVLLIISGFMGITAVFAFFPASSKVLNHLGNANNAGKVFGFYYALEGLGGMAVNLVGRSVYAAGGNELQTFCLVVRLYAVLNLISAVGVYFGLSDVEDCISGNVVSFSMIKDVFKRRTVWLIALITMCNFWLYCSLTYVTPYLTGIYNVTEDAALIYGIIRVNILTVIAGIIFGRLADKRQSALFVIEKVMPLQGMVLTVMLINEIIYQWAPVTILLTMFYAFAATGVKVICLVLISESGFPVMIVGTIIGVVSFIGYSPDAFLYPITGKLLEVYGEQGYLYLFIICIAMSVVSTGCCRILRRTRGTEQRITSVGKSRG